VECRNEFDVRKFKEDFEAGLFVEEANASVEFLKRR
jgi:hypothetical protein